MWENFEIDQDIFFMQEKLNKIELEIIKYKILHDDFEPEMELEYDLLVYEKGELLKNLENMKTNECEVCGDKCYYHHKTCENCL